MEEKGAVFVCVMSENYRIAYDKWRSETRMISVYCRGVTGSDRCTRTTASAPICPSANNYVCSLIAFRTPTFSAIHSSAAGTEALLDLRQFRSFRNFSATNRRKFKIGASPCYRCQIFILYCYWTITKIW